MLNHTDNMTTFLCRPNIITTCFRNPFKKRLCVVKYNKLINKENYHNQMENKTWVKIQARSF